MLEDHRILDIYLGAFTFSPRERARAITSRISSLAHHRDYALERITVSDSESGSLITLDDLMIMTVTDADAGVLYRPRLELAQEYSEKIKNAVAAYRQSRGTRAILTGVGKAVALSLLLATILAMIRRIFPWLERVVRSWKGTVIRTIRFQTIEILNEKRAVAAMVSLLRLLRVAVVFFLLYLYLLLMLTFFVWTQGVADRLFGHIKTPVIKIGQSVLAYLPNVFFVLVIVVCAYYATRFIRFFFNEVEQENITLPGFYPDWARPSYKIARFLIIAFALVMAFPYLPGSDSPAFKGVSIFLGVLFSLGSSSAVSNVIAGVIITYMRAFSVGDMVRIASTEGDVIERNLLVTRIRTPKNVDITIPNALVLGSHIINYSSSNQLILHAAVTIGYAVPWRQVHELLETAAQRTEGILQDPRPFVHQSALNDLAVSYEINAYVSSPASMGDVYSRLHANIQDCFNEAGVEIMSPHVTVLRSGADPAIPPEYRPKDHRFTGCGITLTGE